MPEFLWWNCFCKLLKQLSIEHYNMSHWVQHCKSFFTPLCRQKKFGFLICLAGPVQLGFANRIWNQKVDALFCIPCCYWNSKFMLVQKRVFFFKVTKWRNNPTIHFDSCLKHPLLNSHFYNNLTWKVGKKTLE